MKPLTQKAKQRVLELSKQNESTQYFTVKGVRFKVIGTFLNTNGTWSHKIMNLDMSRKQDRIKTIGDESLQKILNR